MTALAEEHQLDEELQASLIELLSADGRPADALRRYQTVRERIADEIGVEPGARVRHAYLAVLARDRDHRPGPLVETAIPPPAQLPPGLADFTGRDTHLDLLMRALDGNGAPAVAAISGMGGVGKTVLAVHAGHLLATRFSGGQLYADLGGASAEPVDPARVLGGFLTALGIAAHAVPEPLEERTALFRSVLAGRRVLVVLDNAALRRPGTPAAARLAGLGGDRDQPDPADRPGVGPAGRAGGLRRPRGDGPARPPRGGRTRRGRARGGGRDRPALRVRAAGSAHRGRSPRRPPPLEPRLPRGAAR